MNLKRNNVVEAGAGTGKTYLLVQSVLQALFEKRIPLENLVALTFTKKAAGEMKERLAAALVDLARAGSVPEGFLHYGLTLKELQDLATAARDAIDRAEISTIHSFAFGLCRRFPLQAGIDPQSQVDEKGLRFEDVFQREWKSWLSVELGAESPRKESWIQALSRMTLAQIETLARQLADFAIPLSALSLNPELPSATIQEWATELRASIASRPGKVNAARVAMACEEVFGAAAAGAWEKLAVLSEDTLQSLHLDPGKTKEWPSDVIRQLKQWQKAARSLIRGSDRFIADLVALLAPFIERFRSACLAEGHLTHNALLILARDLVRDHPVVRDRLKKDIQLLFIDEFQDTDPVQGELLLFLSEVEGRHETDWRKVRLQPGKLFVVGDPKQSIYRFRGADIRAYREITELIIRQGGERTLLNRSWRSHAGIIDIVNGTFRPMMAGDAGLSPEYSPIEAQLPGGQMPLQGVELRLFKGEEELTSGEAGRWEAADAARWIREHVDAMEIRDRDGRIRRVAYRDIAVIFRSYAPVSDFLESFRESGIPYVVESERFFYSTPEVTTFINLLRLIEQPADRNALVGFLRSPLGGLTDVDIVALSEAGVLNAANPLPASHAKTLAAHTWELIRRLHGFSGRIPLRDILAHVFEETFVLELAASSFHGDQTLANLAKLRRLLETFADEGVTTLSVLLGKIDDFMANDRLEGESALADETYDAVRLLTIHKAKGLEFPIVLLPGLHIGKRPDTREAVETRFEWGSGLLGIKAGEDQTLTDLFLDTTRKAEESAESKRLLYVAMTRAREKLVLSGGLLSRGGTESFLGRLSEAWNLPLRTMEPGIVKIEDAPLLVTLPANSEIQPVPPQSPPPGKLPDPVLFASRWKERQELERLLRATPTVLHPSKLSPAPTLEDVFDTDEEEAESRWLLPGDARLVGILCHRVLETWDFGAFKSLIEASINASAEQLFAEEGLAEGSRSAAIQEEAQRILSGFALSAAYEEIALGTILGREIPFAFFQTDGMLVRGAIDVLYRTAEGQLVVGDYKTNEVGADTAYAAQGAAYCEAVTHVLGETPVFKVLYLKAGSDVSTLTR